jgi:hypothetical protein
MVLPAQACAFVVAGLAVAASAPAAAMSAIGAEVAAVAAGPKAAVVEYVQATGAWPPAAEPTVVGAPETYAGVWVERLDLLERGVVRTTLNAAAGGGSVLLRPREDLSAWDCLSPDVVDVDQHLDGCVWAGPAIGAEVLAAVGPVKAALAEYYAANGALPPAGAAEVAGAPESYAGPWVERLDLLDGGVVRVALTDEAGGGAIDFRASASPTHFAWSCTSDTVAAVEAVLPGCTWSGP